MNKLIVDDSFSREIAPGSIKVLSTVSLTAIIKQLTGTMIGDAADMYYQFIFTNNEVVLELADITGEKPLYSQELIDDTVKRYIEAIDLITIMVTKGFTINELCFVSNKGYSGVSFEYLTPKGAKHTQRYVRDEIPMTLIPNDFLHDLKMIPSRHGV